MSGSPPCFSPADHCDSTPWLENRPNERTIQLVAGLSRLSTQCRDRELLSALMKNRGGRGDFVKYAQCGLQKKQYYNNFPTTHHDSRMSRTFFFCSQNFALHKSSKYYNNLKRPDRQIRDKKLISFNLNYPNKVFPLYSFLLQ